MPGVMGGIVNDVGVRETGPEDEECTK